MIRFISCGLVVGVLQICFCSSLNADLRVNFVSIGEPKLDQLDRRDLVTPETLELAAVPGKKEKTPRRSDLEQKLRTFHLIAISA